MSLQLCAKIINNRDDNTAAAQRQHWSSVPGVNVDFDASFIALTCGGNDTFTFSISEGPERDSRTRRERERETAATERLHGCSTDAINFVSDRPQHTGHADDCRIRNLKLAEQDVSYGHGHVNAAVAMTVVVTHGLRTAGANLEPINEAEWKYCEFI